MKLCKSSVKVALFSTAFRGDSRCAKYLQGFYNGRVVLWETIVWETLNGTRKGQPPWVHCGYSSCSSVMPLRQCYPDTPMGYIPHSDKSAFIPTITLSKFGSNHPDSKHLTATNILYKSDHGVSDHFAFKLGFWPSRTLISLTIPSTETSRCDTFLRM